MSASGGSGGGSGGGREEAGDRKRAASASGGGEDSDVVVEDTYADGPGGGTSAISRFDPKRAKREDDAPQSAGALSEEQKRVADLVMDGQNVRR